MKKRTLIIISLMIFIPSLMFVFLCIGVRSYAKNNVNDEYDEKLFSDAIGSSSTIFYANSNTSDDEYVPVKVDIGAEYKKIYYELDEISDYLIDGFIAVEDRSFYSHSGVDIKRTLYAAANYLSKREKTFGASTITQQVVKNISGDNEVSVRRKINEILRAYNIERSHTKSEIIEVYLNIVPMSDGIVGVGAASEFYFGKLPSEISVAEAATIIGITNAPTAYNPYTNSEKCLQKRNIVLGVMRDQGIISLEEYKTSLNEPLNLIERKNNINSWFIETVTEDVIKDYAAENKISNSLARLLIASGGYSIYTTVNMEVQSILEEYFENQDNFPKEINNGLNYSMIVIDPKNGDILGIVGRVGKKNGNRLINHAEIPHIPASTLKPLALYAPLIDEGKISWSTVFDDIPISFTETSEGYTEFPRNSPNVYDGLITIKEAVEKSKNTVAVRLCKMRGVDKVFDTLNGKYGFNTLIDEQKKNDGSIITDKAVSPMALGQLTVGVPLRKMTEAYTAFSNEGIKNESRTYIEVKDRNGNTVLENKIDGSRVMKKSTAQIMNQLLSNVVESGTARSIDLKNITAVAGKTGTSGGSLEKMFIGYTPYVTAGIWCGHDNGNVPVSDSKKHLEIWDSVMKQICSKVFYDRIDEKFDTRGLVYAPYCMDSGDIYSENCIYDPRGCRMEYGYFTHDSIPTKKCKTHVIVSYDTINKGVVIGDDIGESYAKISLVKNEKRSFPKEIYITDAEYVFRNIKWPIENFDCSLPYFYSQLMEGEYAGISNKKKQFNSFPKNITE